MTELFSTPAGIAISRRTRTLDPANALDGFAERLDGARGALFSSGIDYPGRYSRWEFGFIDPPVEIVGSGRTLTARALNARGARLLAILKPALTDSPEVRIVSDGPRALVIEVAAGDRSGFAEEERSLQPSLFTPLRRLIAEFSGIGDRTLGLYGAFGYDLLFQFDPIALERTRPDGQKDVHLYVPDRMIVIDRRKEQAFQYDYEFARGPVSTRGARRQPYAPMPTATSTTVPPDVTSDHTPEEYMAMVDAVRERMRAATTTRSCSARPSSPPMAARRPRSIAKRSATNAQPVRVSDPVRRRAAHRRVAGDVRARRRRARRDLSDLRHRAAHAAIRCRMPSNIRDLLNSDQGRVRADHVHRRGPQRQVARLRAGHGPGDRRGG